MQCIQIVPRSTLRVDTPPGQKMVAFAMMSSCQCFLFLQNALILEGHLDEHILLFDQALNRRLNAMHPNRAAVDIASRYAAGTKDGCIGNDVFLSMLFLITECIDS